MMKSFMEILVHQGEVMDSLKETKLDMEEKTGIFLLSLEEEGWTHEEFSASLLYWLQENQVASLLPSIHFP